MLKSGVVMPQVALAIQGLRCFHMNFSKIFSESEKNVVGILIVIVLNL